MDNIVNSFTIGSFQIAKGAVSQAPVHVSDERVACERVLGGLDSPTYFEFRGGLDSPTHFEFCRGLDSPTHFEFCFLLQGQEISQS